MRQAALVAVVVAAQQRALGFGGFEHGAAHRHAQVRVLHQHEAAAHGEAVDRDDDRLVHGAPNIRIPGSRRRPADVACRAAFDRFTHVLADAETAPCTGIDRDFQLAAVAKLAPRLGQRFAQLRTQRIHAIRPVHANDHDAVAAFDFDNTHSCLPENASLILERDISAPDELALPTIFANLAGSDLISAANWSGVPGYGSTPWLLSFFLTSGMP